MRSTYFVTILLLTMLLNNVIRISTLNEDDSVDPFNEKQQHYDEQEVVESNLESFYIKTKRQDQDKDQDDGLSQSSFSSYVA
jgi:hypothetical protein